ncbi:MAG: 16S rRNA processing protein RimM [Bacteroidetes bacterium]|nr:16S rRNA processing protein RimM [Bacteroidota bacterium]
MSKTVKIAKATKTFGLNGELVLRLYDTFPDEVNKKEPIFAIINGLTVPLFFSSFEKRGTVKSVVVFDDIDSEYRAKELIGIEFVAFEEEEEETEEENDDNIYLEEFVGYKFCDKISKKEGVIIEFIDNDLNPIFECKIGNKELYIPASDDIIEIIDTENKILTLSIPEGLLDLYL